MGYKWSGYDLVFDVKFIPHTIIYSALVPKASQNLPAQRPLGHSARKGADGRFGAWCLGLNVGQEWQGAECRTFWAQPWAKTRRILLQHGHTRSLVTLQWCDVRAGIKAQRPGILEDLTHASLQRW